MISWWMRPHWIRSLERSSAGSFWKPCCKGRSERSISQHRRHCRESFPRNGGSGWMWRLWKGKIRNQAWIFMIWSPIWERIWMCQSTTGFIRQWSTADSLPVGIGSLISCQISILWRSWIMIFSEKDTWSIVYIIIVKKCRRSIMKTGWPFCILIPGEPVGEMKRSTHCLLICRTAGRRMW